MRRIYHRAKTIEDRNDILTRQQLLEYVDWRISIESSKSSWFGISFWVTSSAIILIISKIYSLVISYGFSIVLEEKVLGITLTLILITNLFLTSTIKRPDSARFSPIKSKNFLPHICLIYTFALLLIYKADGATYMLYFIFGLLFILFYKIKYNTLALKKIRILKLHNLKYKILGKQLIIFISIVYYVYLCFLVTYTYQLMVDLSLEVAFFDLYLQMGIFIFLLLIAILSLYYLSAQMANIRDLIRLKDDMFFHTINSKSVNSKLIKWFYGERFDDYINKKLNEYNKESSVQIDNIKRKMNNMQILYEQIDKEISLFTKKSKELKEKCLSTVEISNEIPILRRLFLKNTLIKASDLDKDFNLLSESGIKIKENFHHIQEEYKQYIKSKKEFLKLEKYLVLNMEKVIISSNFTNKQLIKERNKHYGTLVRKNKAFIKYKRHFLYSKMIYIRYSCAIWYYSKLNALSNRFLFSRDNLI